MGEVAAPLHEIFFSIQGEGLWVGVPQLFVRVRGCDLACYYCDTPQARNLQGDVTVYLPDPSSSQVHANPFLLDELLTILDTWQDRPEAPRLHSVALTGGEPLLYPDYAAALGKALNCRELPLYLETGGHRPEQLSQVIDQVDFVSLDYKLSTTLPVPVPAERFAQSIRLAARTHFFVKIVVTDRITDTELEEALHTIAEAEPCTSVVLQPVTGSSLAGGPPSADQLLSWQRLAGRFLDDVRIIPQCHKLLGLC